MFLLNQDYQNVINNAKSNLHPIMFLLNPKLFEEKQKATETFTSHYVPIKS